MPANSCRVLTCFADMVASSSLGAAQWAQAHQGSGHAQMSDRCTQMSDRCMNHVKGGRTSHRGGGPVMVAVSWAPTPVGAIELTARIWDGYRSNECKGQKTPSVTTAD